MEKIISTISSLVWSNWLVYLCLLTGIFFSIRTRFLQVRRIKDMAKLLFDGKSSEKGVSSFQAFSIAISSRVGTGNIAGVATAIFYGGPGALFWMWAIAFLGASSAFVESTLSQIYKEERDGEYRGGPSYYIKYAIGHMIKSPSLGAALGLVFAVITAISCGVLLPGVQSNSIVTGFKNAFNIPPLITGLIIAAILGIIIFGGTKRIGNFAQIVVPIMATGYILIALVIIAVNIGQLPGVIAEVFSSAFGANAAFGGIIGSAISWGVKRGIYSNEAGQGTGAMASGAAEVSHPAKQGLVQAFSVYIDTLFVCSATGFMILITKCYNVVDSAGGFIVEYMPGVETGPSFTQAAVDTMTAGYGSKFVAIALFFFAFTTIMAYYYYAETSIAYILNTEKSRKIAIQAVRVSMLIMVVFSSLRTATLAWDMGDIGVGVMAWMNIVAIWIIQKPAFLALKDYEDQKNRGLDPVFDPEKLGIKNTKAWGKSSNLNI